MPTNRRNFLRLAGAGIPAGYAGYSWSAQARQADAAAVEAPPAPEVAPGDTTDLAKASLPPEENELSRRYLRIMEKWIPVGVEYFAPWPERPNCGHFFGGVHWYGNETVGPAETFALASLSPEYDEAATGVSRAELRRMAIQAVRYLCFTHDTGPADCVRPKVGLGRPENGGTKWGERGKGFFKESQCGSGVAALGRISLLLRDDIDEETWLMVARIHADYAQRFGQLPPESGVYRNTQMEENAWTSAGLASCCLFLARHRESAAWENAARRWMFATCTVPQDAADAARLGSASVSSRVGTTFTALPDYWAENHGMVHPSYTASGVGFLLGIGCQWRLWGRELPPELFWNRRRVYENLKALTDDAGYCQAIQGMDWHYLPTLGSGASHAIAAVFFHDAEAAALERRALRNSELRQEGNGGRLYDKALAERAHDQQDPMIMREIKIDNAAQLYLLHRLFGPGPEPLPEEELEKRLRGVRVYPHAGFVHHRHAHGQTSFSWRNSIMALPLTREGIYTISPCSNTWLGTPVVKGRPDSQRLVSVRVAEADDTFAACLVIDRCQESLRQQALFASLPDGRVLTWERFVALEDLTLDSLDQGFLRITNETFARLGPNCRGVRTLYHPGGAKDYRGWLGDKAEDDVVDVLGRPAWLNVDDRMGLRVSGPGQAVYHNRHYFKPYRAVADDLTLSRLEAPRQFRKGESTAPLAALLAPGEKHADTAAAHLRVLAGPDQTACVATDGYLAAANFLPASQVCVFRQPRPATVPIWRGATIEVTTGGLECAIRLGARSAVLLECLRVVRVFGDVRLDAGANGTVFAANTGAEPASVQIASGQSAGQRHVVAPGEIKAI